MKKRLIALSRAAIWGGVSFAALSAIVVIGEYFFGGNLFLSLSFLVGTPALLLGQGTGTEAIIEKILQNNFSACCFIVLLNSVLGIILVSILVAFWQFLAKDTFD